MPDCDRQNARQRGRLRCPRHTWRHQVRTSRRDRHKRRKTATGTGFADVVNDFGNEDDCSIYLDLTPGSSESYIGTDALKTPYFTEDDAKNGDVISLYFYVPANSNLASFNSNYLELIWEIQ